MVTSSDLTVIYYSARVIAEHFASAVQAELLACLRQISPRPTLVTVTHGWPLTFGDVNLTVGDPVPSISQVYRNVLFGCHAATTPYVAFAEDDTCYVPEHFAYRPALDTFSYNEQRLVLTRRLSADGTRREAIYFFNPRTQMAMGIAPRQLLIETLEERFAKHPNPPLDTTVAKNAGHGEPGRYEKNLGLTPRKLERFPWTTRPNITVNHSASLMGRRAVKPHFETCSTVEPWGEANALWERIHG